MLTDEQMKEWFNVASRSPNGVMPFVTEVVFSGYCSTKLQIGMLDGEGDIASLCTVSSPVRTGVWVDEVMEIITSV